MLSIFFGKSFGIKYEARGDKLLIISESGEIDQNGVRSQGKYNLFEEVRIEEGPTAILLAAFGECRRLVKVSIPASVVTITSPFFRTPKLKEIIVASGNNNFYTDSQGVLLSTTKSIVRVPSKSVTLAEGPTKICKFAFGVATDFTWNQIVIPKSVETLEFDAFNEASFGSISFAVGTKISELGVRTFRYSHYGVFKVPTSVKTLNFDVFYGSSINKLIFEEVSQLATIKGGAFQSTTLDSIELPDSLVTIEANSFSFSTVKSIAIGASCSSISTEAFKGCTSLKQFTVSDNNQNYSSYGPTIMNKIKTKIVFISPGLTNLTIIDSVVEIGSTLLQQQENLTKIELQSNAVWATESGVLYSSDYSTLVAVCGGVTDLSIRSDVTTIGENAAASCKKLTSATFLGTLCTSISSYAFSETCLETFTLPNSVKFIGPYAFRNNAKLTSFIINESSSLQDINEHAFESDVFETINIPSSVLRIRYRAFRDSLIKNVNFAPNSQIDEFEKDVFFHTSIVNFIVPNSVTKIQSICFAECFSLVSITFEETSKLQTIDDFAFKLCKKLLSVNLPPSCQVLGPSAFTGCIALNSFTYTSLNSIGSSCFDSCRELKEFFIGSNITELNSNTFLGCDNLYKFVVAKEHSVFCAIEGAVFLTSESSLYLYPPGRDTALIPSSTLKFRTSAFSGCNKLKNLIFQSGCKMTTFGNSAFLNCISLRSILFPPLINTIEDDCFKGCASLRSVFLPSEITKIGTGAFKDCVNLRTVKYCGTNIVEGTDVFPSSVQKIYVTQYYNGNSLCSYPVSNTLGDDCELHLPEKSQKKCFGNLPIFYTLSLLLIL